MHIFLAFKVSNRQRALPPDPQTKYRSKAELEQLTTKKIVGEFFKCFLGGFFNANPALK